MLKMMKMIMTYLKIKIKKMNKIQEKMVRKKILMKNLVYNNYK